MGTRGVSAELCCWQPSRGWVQPGPALGGSSWRGARAELGGRLAPSPEGEDVPHPCLWRQLERNPPSTPRTSARCRGSLTGSFRAAVAAEEGSAARRGAGGSGNRRPAALRGLASAGSSSPAAARCGPSPGSRVLPRVVPTASSLAGRPSRPHSCHVALSCTLFFC